MEPIERFRETVVAALCGLAWIGCGALGALVAPLVGLTQDEGFTAGMALPAVAILVYLVQKASAE